MVVNNQAKDLLVELGLSEYEALAYLSLLGCQPATAYELAKVSGIPSSKIYETANRLLDKGLIEPVSADTGRGQRYIALGAEDFIAAKRQQFERRTTALEPLLRQTGNGLEADFIWQLDDEAAIYDKARQLLGQAKDSILVSLWPDAFDRLYDDLQAAENRGARLALVHYGPPTRRLGATFHHPAEATVARERGGRNLTLAVDGTCVVIATFFDNGRVEGAWSRNRAFVFVAEDYVRHDVYITKVTGTMDTELKQRFGADYADLRDVFKSI
jgi:HTH-type transcriptional regulator, sugar sensing transcriptional regulator